MVTSILKEILIKVLINVICIITKTETVSADCITINLTNTFDMISKACHGCYEYIDAMFLHLAYFTVMYLCNKFVNAK